MLFFTQYEYSHYSRAFFFGTMASSINGVKDINVQYHDVLIFRLFP